MRAHSGRPMTAIDDDNAADSFLAERGGTIAQRSLSPGEDGAFERVDSSGFDPSLRVGTRSRTFFTAHFEPSFKFKRASNAPTVTSRRAPIFKVIRRPLAISL